MSTKTYAKILYFNEILQKNKTKIYITFKNKEFQ